MAPNDAGRPVLQGHEVVVLHRGGVQRVVSLGEPSCQKDDAQRQNEDGVLGHQEVVKERSELAQAGSGREEAAVDDVPVKEDGHADQANQEVPHRQAEKSRVGRFPVIHSSLFIRNLYLYKIESQNLERGVLIVRQCEALHMTCLRIQHEVESNMG